MFTLADVIVGFWFLPVTLFIIIPLLMLCAWLLFRFVRLPKLSEKREIRSEVIEDRAFLHTAN
ncbi:MAG: hypothetical protein V2I36_14570 [Desulfopila sp.]|jgi:uncharacterized membrane protein|nr:hypothetical protein [Desulfopila sp.]